MRGKAALVSRGRPRKRRARIPSQVCPGPVNCEQVEREELSPGRGVLITGAACAKARHSALHTAAAPLASCYRRPSMSLRSTAGVRLPPQAHMRLALHAPRALVFVTASAGQNHKSAAKVAALVLEALEKSPAGPPAQPPPRLEPHSVRDVGHTAITGM